MRVVLLGPPGSGKGTQAEVLAKTYGIVHISTGDLFRDHLSRGTQLGQLAQQYMSAGTLVPDDVTEAMVAGRIAQADAQSGFVMDGFPRNLRQAQDFDQMLAQRGLGLEAAVLLTVPRDRLIQRLTGRRVCPQCQATYHVVFHPPQVPGVCDVCGAELVQRPDDREATVRQRLAVYDQETAVLIPYYRERGQLVEIDGDRPPAEVSNALVDALGGLSGD